ncbi:MAG: multi-sensor signal transduction histidine kinase, partial [Actinomycetia bacterium]|nr:multi-sensor signal transduction histidine kinase [Actinomycetes bacterium]
MRRGLTQRTVLASILVTVVVLGEFAVLFLAFQSLRAEERQDNQAVNVLATSSALEESLLNMSTGLRIYLMSGQPAGLRPYLAALAAYPRQARQLDRLTAGNPGLHGRVVSIGNSVGAYVGTWTTAIIKMSSVDLPGARRLAATDAAKQPVVVIRDQFAALDRQQQALSAVRRAGAAHSAALALWFGVAGLVAAVLLLTGWAIGLHRMVVRPVKRLAEAVGRLRGGDLSARVPERGTGELGELAVGFNAMAQELEAARDEVEQQNAELQGQQAELQTVLASVERQKEEAEALHHFG